MQFYLFHYRKLAKNMIKLLVVAALKIAVISGKSSFMFCLISMSQFSLYSQTIFLSQKSLQFDNLQRLETLQIQLDYVAFLVKIIRRKKKIVNYPENWNSLSFQFTALPTIYQPLQEDVQKDRVTLAWSVRGDTSDNYQFVVNVKTYENSQNPNIKGILREINKAYTRTTITELKSGTTYAATIKAISLDGEDAGD